MFSKTLFNQKIIYSFGKQEFLHTASRGLRGEYGEGWEGLEMSAMTLRTFCFEGAVHSLCLPYAILSGKMDSLSAL